MALPRLFKRGAKLPILLTKRRPPLRKQRPMRKRLPPKLMRPAIRRMTSRPVSENLRIDGPMQRPMIGEPKQFSETGYIFEALCGEF